VVTLKDFVANTSKNNDGLSDITNPDSVFYLGFSMVEINIMKAIYNQETNESIMRENCLNKKELKVLIDKIKQELGDRYGL